MRYLSRRLLQAVPVWIGVTVVSFSVIHLLPGNPATVILGSQATPSLVRATMAKLGLERPLLNQYFDWIGGIVRGHLGSSFISGDSVVSVILRSLPPTIELLTFALFIALAVGVPLGVFTSQRTGAITELGIRLGVLLGISTPSFVVGSLLILIGNMLFSNMRMLGYVSLSVNPIYSLEIMFWPALTLALTALAIVMRFTRVSMATVLREDYMFTAKAMGIGRRTRIYRNALQNALIPVVGAVGAQIAYLIGGVVVVEQVFNIPGLGSLTLTSINNRDYSVLQGIVLFVATGVIMVNISVNLIYRKLDPRLAR